MADDLIHEVEESLKQERLERLWKDYGSYLIAAIILTILLTALVTGWRGWNSKVNISQTSSVIEALEQEDQVSELEKIMTGLRPGHRAISHLTAAGLLLRDDKKEEALKHYKGAANNKDLAPVFRDLAQLMAVRLEWSMEESETGPQTLLAMLKPLWEDQSSPWQWHARMQAAIIEAHANTDYTAAHDHLSAVMTAQNIPSSLIERARALDQVYALKEGPEG